MKTITDLKASPLDDDAFRLLAIPFTGPVRSNIWPRGVDLDGETFTARTDIKADWLPFRPTDWHHGGDRVPNGHRATDWSGRRVDGTALDVPAAVHLHPRRADGEQGRRPCRLLISDPSRLRTPMTDFAKSFEMAAEPMTSSELDRWLQGKIPRRHLAVPFGGPVKSKSTPLGVDNEGEWFDEDTDLYGNPAELPQLHKSRNRLVDWHHVAALPKQYSDPTGVMKGAVLGYMHLDKQPSTEEIEGEKFYGVWADMWANVGEHRRFALGALERRGASIWGSSVPVAKATVIEPSGHIKVWPIRYQGLTTDPINRNAVLPRLAKAEFSAFPNIAELPVSALRAYLAGEDDLGQYLQPTSERGEDGAKAGRVLSGINEADIDEAVATLLGAAERLKTVLARHRKD